jgi:phosphatidylserine synthase
MSWRGYQRIFEITAIGAMMAGVVMMWMRLDPDHYLVYGGFLLLASGKLIEALNLNDPNFKIIKISACASIYALVSLNLFAGIRTIVYILIPLGVYYALHYRLILQQKRT